MFSYSPYNNMVYPTHLVQMGIIRTIMAVSTRMIVIIMAPTVRGPSVPECPSLSFQALSDRALVGVLVKQCSLSYLNRHL